MKKAKNEARCPEDKSTCVSQDLPSD